MIRLPWGPMLGPKLRKEFKKKDIKTMFTSGAKSVLCQNKSKPLPTSYPGIYASTCTCNEEYMGETKKKIDHQSNRTPTRYIKD